MRIAVLVASAGLVGCSYLPAQQERARTEHILDSIDNVMIVTMGCGSRVFAGDQLCAHVVMKDGAQIRFSHLGFSSFGSTATNVFVEEAGGLAPRVASCDGAGAANFHRLAPLGHHFHPTLIDVKEAVERYREVLREVQYWPECPQSWEVQDKFGANYRYCQRRPAATLEPPPPSNCRR